MSDALPKPVVSSTLRLRTRQEKRTARRIASFLQSAERSPNAQPDLLRTLHYPEAPLPQRALLVQRQGLAHRGDPHIPTRLCKCWQYFCSLSHLQYNFRLPRGFPLRPSSRRFLFVPIHSAAQTPIPDQVLQWLLDSAPRVDAGSPNVSRIVFLRVSFSPQCLFDQYSTIRSVCAAAIWLLSKTITRFETRLIKSWLWLAKTIMPACSAISFIRRVALA